MIELCKHLCDNGNCKIKTTASGYGVNCPAIERSSLTGKISRIDVDLMHDMACSDKWNGDEKQC
jgi:hypothetical protein